MTDVSASSGSAFRPAKESVRLVVWDLDETFWKGTLTEGGISEYVQEHHDAVIELARRGIMSSICSKNNPDEVLPILREKSILDYFIFPSISWESKGARLAALVEAVQLRPTTVMFVDDNPSNLAEAVDRVPGIQVEGADFIGRMLNDPRFRGKDDSGLKRLAQYKLLEARKRDERRHSGDNSEFLRACDIRVYIEHDVFSHLDRAVELVNRTNQLNFTKKRLPQDPEAARAKLSKHCDSGQHRQAGLVRVVDKYGDYGFVGFYAMRNRRRDPAPGLANARLVHYCFSCRTLGMFVEHWLYDQLRRPSLEIVGEVLTDLNEPRTIDWIRHVPFISEDAETKAKLAPEIRVCGGCEANSVAHYLGGYCDRVSVIGNFPAGPVFVRTNSCFLLLSAAKHADSRVFHDEMSLLGIPAPLLGTDYFRNVPNGTVFVFNGGMDPFGGFHRVRHRLHGWEIHLKCGDSTDFVTTPLDQGARLVSEQKTDAARQQLEFVMRHVRENYEIVGDTGSTVESGMEELVQRIPQGSKLVILLDDERRRNKQAGIKVKSERTKYNVWARSFADRFPFVGVVGFSDAIQNEDEILAGGNHYAREVYWRAAEKVVEVARQLVPKGSCETLAVGDGLFRLEERLHIALEAGESVPPVHQEVLRVSSIALDGSA